MSGRFRYQLPSFAAGALLAFAVAAPASADEPASAPPVCDGPARDRPPDPRCGETLDTRAPTQPPESLDVPRAVLWAPRAASRALFWPVVKTEELVESHRLFGWMEALLTTDDRQVGVRPELNYTTSFLPTGGLRLFYRRLPGEGTEASARLLTGGPTVWLGQVGLRGPDWTGLSLTGTYNQRDDFLFAAIGPNSNADLAAAGREAARYQSALWMAELRWTRALSPRLLRLALHGDLQRRDNSANDVRGGPSVAAVFGLPSDQCAAAGGAAAGCVDDALVPGFARGVRVAHGGATLVLDTRPHTRDGGGFSSAVDATVAQGIAGDPSRHLAASAEAVVAFGGTDRQLLLRGRAAVVEALGGGAIPFQELVSPAGMNGMRGFADGRFRGQSGIIGTAEYRYFIASAVDAALFSDVGTVGGRGFSGMRADRLFPTFGLAFRVYHVSGPHWEATPTTGLQLAYAPEGGVRLSISVAAF